jgi:U3 small nucleolar RNA-associated protein 4
MRSHKKELHYTISGLRQHPPIDGCAARSLFVCWWEREVSIWKLSKSKDHKKHRLLARIALKGEENISYTSISSSGSLLATATTAELKIFSLKQEQDGGKESLTVQKLVTTSEVSSKLVEFSPDEKWIAVVTHANTVEVINTNEFIQRGNFLGRRELRRVKRDSASDGPLGLYKRTINRITFSPDSAMLVVSDISGYLDSWVLLEETKPVKVNGTTNHNHDSSDSEESESEESDVESQADGPRWKINPATTKLPKLDSQPLVLSFRRHWPGTSSVENSPSTPYDLLVLTSQHHLWELDLISGSLTEWSRKNPTSSLPDEFRALLDRAMGSFWGSDGWWWIYGSTWLFGINVTVDHIRGGTEATSNSVIEATNSDRKRKRGADGAGGKTKKDSLEGLVSLADESDTEAQINGTVSSDKMDIDQEDEEEDFGTTLIGGLRGGEIGKGEDGGDRPKWFMALKYRPILGIVPVGQENGKPVEVVLVERPIWDLNLPPRFEKIQDR